MSAPLRYVDEVFEKIDKAGADEKVALLKEWGVKHPYNMLLALNFDDRVKFDVPEGMPPYKRDETQHPDTYQTTLSQQIKRLGSIITGRNDQTKNRCEAIFIQVLEGIPHKEADVLIFAKDGALEEMYPTITRALVAEHFPKYNHVPDTK